MKSKNSGLLQPLLQHQIHHRLLSFVGPFAMVLLKTVRDPDDAPRPPLVTFAPGMRGHALPRVAVEHRRVHEMVQRTHTCPAATEAVVANICITNISGAPAAYRIAIRPNGDAINDKHYIVYDAGVDAFSYEFLTMPITLDANDVISVYASHASVAFNVF